jgi:hypothetical protein
MDNRSKVNLVRYKDAHRISFHPTMVKTTWYNQRQCQSYLHIDRIICPFKHHILTHPISLKLFNNSEWPCRTLLPMPSFMPEDATQLHSLPNLMAVNRRQTRLPNLMALIVENSKHTSPSAKSSSLPHLENTVWKCRKF